MTRISSHDQPMARSSGGLSPLAVPSDLPVWVELLAEPIPVEAAVSWATTPASGAVVSFLGVVRDHADGRDDVTGLTYEAYESAAINRMHAIVREARRQFPTIERVALLHRIGPLSLSDVAVAVVVSTPHRGAAFDAGRYCIDTLKDTVPIWKHEHWAGGSDWGVDARPIEPVPSSVDIPSPLQRSR
jgi:molybdopterin synthase catalytic subunit